MMTILMFSFMLLWVNPSMVSSAFLMVFSMGMLSLVNSPFMFNSPLVVISEHLILDPLSFLLLLLSLLLILSMLLGSSPLSSLYLSTHELMGASLALAFLFKNFIMFYVSFEFSLLPISFMILGWGYQPERSKAFTYMFMYTIAGSLPLLLIIVFLMNNLSVCLLSELPTSSYVNQELKVVSLLCATMVMSGFLIKFPMYGVHLWLPKAHVEAPVSGSMILAALLLKLGGFGFFLIQPLVESSLWLQSIASFSLSGGVLVAFLCLRQMDMKVLIAYSSVVHLSATISALCLKTMSAFISVGMVLVAHGLSSPGLFFSAFVLYKRSHSRSLLMNFSGVSTLPYMSLSLFLLAMGNMGAPPTLNFVSELVTIVALNGVTSLFMTQMALLVFLGGAYTIVLYLSSQHSVLKGLTATSEPVSVQEGVPMLMLISGFFFMTVVSLIF